MERRRYPRYKVLEGAYAVVKTHEEVVSPIVDISRGGLSLLWPPEKSSIKTSSELDLVYAISRFRLRGLPFETVSETEMPLTKPSKTGPLRRLGAKFGALSENQVSRLNHFIRNFTKKGM